MGSLESNDFAFNEYINTTQKKIINYENKLRDFHNKAYVYYTENQKLEKQKQHLIDKIDEYKKNIEEMSVFNIANQNKMLELKEACKNLVDEIKNTKNEKNKLSELNTKLQDQINNVTEENKELRNEYHFKEEYQKLQNKINELTTEINTLQKNSEVNSDIPNEEVLKEDINLLTNENKKLQLQIDELNAKLTKKNNKKPVVNVEIIDEETNDEQTGEPNSQKAGAQSKKIYATPKNLKTLLSAKLAGENEYIAKQINLKPQIGKKGKKTYPKKYVIDTIISSPKLKKSAIKLLNDNYQKP